MRLLILIERWLCQIKAKNGLWRWLFWLFLAAALWFFIGRKIDIINLVSVFKQGLPIFLILAFCLQIASHSLRAILFQQAFYSVKVRSHFRDLLPAVFGALFMNVVVSFGGAGGFIFLIEDAKNRGHSAARATAGSLMIITTDFISITIISIIGLIYLFTKDRLQNYEIAAAVILIVLTLFLSSMMILTFRWPKHLKSILLSFRNAANRVLKKFGKSFTITENWVDQHFQEFVNAAAASKEYQNRALIMFGLSLGTHLISLICFYTLFIAFQQPISYGTLIAGYAMGILFAIVSPTPQGIGIVEGIVPIVLSPLGIPFDKAVVTVLAFRALSLWLPLLIGFLVIGFRKIKDSL